MKNLLTHYLATFYTNSPLNFKLLSKPYILAGPQIGFLLDTEKKEFDFGDLKSLDYGLNVGIGTDKQNLIRNSPKEKDEKIIINSCKYESMKVIDIIKQNGEFWIEISFATNCEAYPEDNAERKTGWIKWRNSEKLLVIIQLFC